MSKNVSWVMLAVLVSAGMVFADGKSKSATAKKAATKTSSRTAAGPMQVDEPSNKRTPKPEFKISKAQRERLQDLTFEQKLAFRLHQEKMQAMISVITEKRRVLQAAKPRERAALAMELHTYILERESAGRGAAVSGHGPTAKEADLSAPVSAAVVK